LPAASHFSGLNASRLICNRILLHLTGRLYRLRQGGGERRGQSQEQGEEKHERARKKTRRKKRPTEAGTLHHKQPLD
jgi:hypothetical protein